MLACNGDNCHSTWQQDSINIDTFELTLVTTVEMRKVLKCIIYMKRQFRKGKWVSRFEALSSKYIYRHIPSKWFLKYDVKYIRLS